MIISLEIIQLLLILLLLRIVDREELHEEIGWISESWDRFIDLLEVVSRLFGITLIHDITIAHQNESVKEEECL